MKQAPRFILFMTIAFLLGSGCKKNSSDTSLLVFNIHPYFGNDSIIAGKSYRSALGDSLSFNRTSFYISEVELITTSGTAVAVPGYTLVTASTGLNIVVGSIPTGTYKSISFSVGIPADSDQIDPGNYSSGPLAAQNPSMHFSTDANGYIFMAVEGLFDSTSTHLSPNKAFSYHIGTTSLFETVTLPDHSVAPYTAFNANGGQLVTINMIADFSQLLQNINIVQNPVTNSTDYVVVADTLANHIPNMFRYQN